MSVKPYSDNNESKKSQVRSMFNNIAHRYDFLNHFLSAGIDRYWRKKALLFLKDKDHSSILDIATGTGDFAILAYKMLQPVTVTGIDISEKMLALGNKKIAGKMPGAKIKLITGDSENLDFKDHTFQVVTVAFGVRNFENIEKGLSEMYRVLKPGGWMVILEFSKPVIFPVKQLFGLYFKYILPLIGTIISTDTKAYRYLPESVNLFPEGKNFIRMLEKTGFINCSFKPLTFGIATNYTARKPSLLQ
ncbi:MAG: bifunctional demethylmenaquinone methyltransferase/2-methoxy-6-polyprenyl-1,4-benzoquinol methylase UbiE [Bacteroidales bacterium]|nr:bifunctional demethylmenaquinone methyltransferase/2-methoxy-6-polyprenyl-1,4-benzoquinol methylase UbiE [Bacteroidales bacterium]